ncbi:hypothetical protein ACJ72_06709, partial [Emergomyces africanus]
APRWAAERSDSSELQKQELGFRWYLNSAAARLGLHSSELHGNSRSVRSGGKLARSFVLSSSVGRYSEVPQPPAKLSPGWSRKQFGFRPGGLAFRTCEDIVFVAEAPRASKFSECHK